MSDIKNLMELNELINNESSLRKDLSEATELIKKMFRQKYISRLEKELTVQKQNHIKNPSKEIQLIQAVKPFVDKSKHSEIDSITDTLVNISTLMDIRKDFEENTKKSKDEDKKVAAMNVVITEKDDSSIKKDGIYDIDEKCAMSKQNTVKKETSNNMIYLLFAFILFNSRIMG